MSSFKEQIQFSYSMMLLVKLLKAFLHKNEIAHMAKYSFYAILVT